MLERGYWTAFRLRGAPVRLHWTIPLGALLFGGFRFVPAFWGAFFFLILIHELGHATLVRAFGHRVMSIDILGFGGFCRWSGVATQSERGAIAWGGVLAQAVALIVTIGVLLVFGRPTTIYGAQVAEVFINTNLWLIALNLLPVPPLDGAEAWRFVTDLFRHGRKAWPRFRGRVPGSVEDASTWSLPFQRSAPKPRGARAPHKPAPQRSPSPEAAREIADLLKRVGNEAGRARRGN
jgi:Zn-dependent protease